MIGLELIVKSKGMEFQEVAEVLEVSKQTVSDWIREKRKIPPKRAFQLSNLFEIDENLIVKKIEKDDVAKIYYQLGMPLATGTYKVQVENDEESSLKRDYQEQLSLDVGNDIQIKGPENQGTLSDLTEQIKEERKRVKTDEIDITISELLNMYNVRKVLDIHPEFQRLYRWTPQQKSKLIESILLGIPIPPLFVAETKDAAWDVIDGVQRLSTFFQFMGVLYDEDDQWVKPYFLEGTERLPALQGKVWSNAVPGCENRYAFENNSELANKFLYSKVKVIRVSNESTEDAKYDLFDRLNSGGTTLEPQEIRNCMAIMMNRDFYVWLRKLSLNPDFVHTLPLSDTSKNQQEDMEYALRFFVYRKSVRGNIKDGADYTLNDDIKIVLTRKMQKFCKEEILDYAKEKEIFDKTFELLNKATGENSFKKYNSTEGTFKGKVMLTSFELIAIGVANNLDYILGLQNPIEYLRNKIKVLYKQEFYKKSQNIFSGKAVTRFDKLTELGTEYFSY
ncbi:DUF262 domain-containing protein [Bacillus sp. NPDC077411]|uniref:GmrSD restriction endonuclease domain-containing protein n=1 Tax=Bacillus sp. NPDC077411 TaxID=3363947 RepID=UPI0037C4F025